MKKLEDDSYEGWFVSKWRPAMAWSYLSICLFDFMIAPIMNALYSTWAKSPFVPWDPLTIKGGGIYHLAMGAVIGVTAWTRGNERVKMMEFGFPRKSWYGEDQGNGSNENENTKEVK